MYLIVILQEIELGLNLRRMKLDNRRNVIVKDSRRIKNFLLECDYHCLSDGTQCT